MSKSMKADFRALGSWFDRQKRVLPWRDEPSLYRVWVSEIMLQQTQVVTVVPYFERWMKALPTVKDLASASEAQVMKLWEGLGYYSRARNLRKGAIQIVEAGAFPQDRAGWLEIPGVGPYTAGAILSISLNQVEAILDGNVERVLSRYRRVDRSEGDRIYKERLWDLAERFVRHAQKVGVEPRDFNQALMELGATHCSPKAYRCDLCPFRAGCEARVSDEVSAYPPKKKPKQWKQVEETLYCIVDSRGRVLLRQRQAGEWRAGLWDFLEKPKGAKTQYAELGEVETKHVVTTHKIRRKTHVLKLKKAPAWRAAERDEHRWVNLKDPDVAMGSALKRTLRQIHEVFPGILKGY